MEQYHSIKEKYKDAILLFRVGDFYETFGDDAETVARVMEVILVHMEEAEAKKWMASLPFYSLDNALHMLTSAGYRVAVCDQLEEPKAGPMKRGVTELRNGVKKQ